MTDIPAVSEGNFHAYFDTVPAPVALLDSRFRFVDLNQAFEERLGARGQSWRGADSLNLFEPVSQEEPQDFTEALGSAEPGLRQMRCRVRSFGDATIDAEIAIAAIDNNGHRQYLLTIRDLAPPMRREQVLFSREEMFRLLIEQSPVPISIQDAQFKYLHVNPAYCGLVGYTQEELIGRDPITLIHPPEMTADLGSQRSKLIGADLGHLPRFSHLRELVHRSGRRIPYRLELGYSKGSDGSTLWCATLIDLSVLNDTLVELDAQTRLATQAHDKFETFAGLISDGMVVIDPAGNRIIHANPAVREVLALPLEAVEHMPADQLWKQVRREDQANLQALIGRRDPGNSSLTVGVLHPNGEVRAVRLRLYTNGQPQRELYVIAEDVTENMLRERERRVEEVEHRNALVREVHHRIKNNLQGVAGLLEQAAYRQPALKSGLDGVATQIRSIATVHGLQVVTGNVLEIGSLASAVAESVYRRFGHPIASTSDLDEEAEHWGLVEHDAVPVALALNELLTNATKHHRGEQAVLLHVQALENEVCVRVTNRGRLPEGFNFDQGTALPGGLKLIKALIPKMGCRIKVIESGGFVIAELTLGKPSIARTEQPARPPQISH